MKLIQKGGCLLLMLPASGHIVASALCRVLKTQGVDSFLVNLQKRKHFIFGLFEYNKSTNNSDPIHVIKET
jgi:hypothetical protein